MGDKAERLVNVTIALLEAWQPITFEQLRERTGYYQQEDFESARRMFERDKDDLRGLGVPIETRPVGGLDPDHGYTIERDDYELAPVDLAREEVAALAVALKMTDPGRARLALTKLAAQAPEPLNATPAVPAHVSVDVDRMDELAAPLLERRAVRFRYRTGAGEEAERTVDPYAVVTRQSAWYLVGRDHERDALRAFRLDRMISRVRPIGDPGGYDVPHDLDLRGAVSGPAEHGVEALVAVRPSARWEAELRGGVATGEEHDGWPVYRFEDAAPWQLRTWVLASGADAVVVQPASLRRDVVAALESVVETSR